MRVITFDEENPAVVVKWKIKPNYNIYQGMQVLLFRDATNGDANSGSNSVPKNASELKKLKVKDVGTVRELLVKPGDVVQPGAGIFTMEPCRHPTVMKEMCAECGADLQSTGETKTMTAAIPIVHNIPELMVSPEEAQTLGQAEEQRLLKERKLVLLVDLDQTLIHTTNDIIPPNIKDVYHYKLGANPVWYHTRLRPHAREFLRTIADLFELHICTFGARAYAHQIAFLLDPEGRYFSTRILSRDECFDPRLKTANLKALFPCGDHMVCIIDDREDVWNWAPNLVRVKPYHFFRHTGDINAPPGMTKAEDDDKFGGIDLLGKSGSGGGDEKNVSEKMEEGERKEKAEAGEAVAKSLPSKESDAKDEEEEKEKESEKSDSDADSSDDEGGSSSASEHERKGKPVEKKDTDDAEMKSVSSEPSPPEKMEENGVPVKYVSTSGEKPTPKSAEGRTEEEGKESSGDEKGVGAEKKTKGEPKMLNPDDLDDYLLHLEAILKQVHAKFFATYDGWKSRKQESPEKVGPLPDLKTIIPEIRGNVLTGVNLVFSGVVPTRTPMKQSVAYRVATTLGANATENLVEDGPLATTHLVAQRYGTAKVHQVKKKPGIFVVTPDWLWCCAERWERVDERLFRLSKEHNANSSSSTAPPVMESQPIVPRAQRSNKRTPSMSELSHLSSARGDEDGSTTDSQGSSVIVSGVDTNGDAEEKFEETLKNPYLMFSKEELDDMDKEVDEMCSSESSSSEDESSGGAGGKSPSNGEKVAPSRASEEEIQNRRRRISQSIDVDFGESEGAATAMDEEGTCTESDGDGDGEGDSRPSHSRRRRKRRKVVVGTTTDDSDINAGRYPTERLIGNSTTSSENGDDDDEDEDDILNGLAHQLEERMDHRF